MADCYQVPNSSSDLALRDSYWSTYDCYLLLGLRTDPFTAYLESLTPGIHVGPDETPHIIMYHRAWGLRLVWIFLSLCKEQTKQCLLFAPC